MADEPRRSGRATKGQHTKNDDSLEAEQTKKGKGKKAAKKAEAEDEEDDAIIRCICGIQKDIEGMMMICCDRCEAWQHNVCMGITEVEDQLPAHYFCELCRPEDHKELIDTMSEGARPDEIATRRREEKKKGKKGKGAKKGKGGRQSKGPELKSENSNDLATPSAGKHESGSPPAIADVSSRKQNVEDAGGVNNQGSPRRRSSSNIFNNGAETSGKKRKVSVSVSSGRKVPKVVDPNVLVNSLSELSNTSRYSAANQLMKRIALCVKNVTSKGLFRIPDGETPNSLGEHFALRVEHALFLKYASETNEFGGPYKNQMLQIYFNIDKNDRLALRLLDGSLLPQNLVTMSSDEMASDELQAEMAAMLEQSDKQNTLVQEEGPRIRRTHKGEEVIEDQYDHVSSEAISAPYIPRRRSSAISMGSDHSRQIGEPMSPDVSSPPQPMLARQSSSNFDINNVWSNVQSPAVERRPSQATRYPEPAPSGAVDDDAEIDRLLNDDENDAQLPGQSDNSRNIIWKGSFDMLDGKKISHISKFDAQAYHVAGSDLANRAPLSTLFSQMINIKGALSLAEADAYICSLSSARNIDVTVFEFTTQRDDSASQEEFNKLYNALVPKQRCVVIDTKYNPRIRDAYVLALEPGLGDMPLFLQRLDHVKIEQPRPRKTILAVFVLKWLDSGSANVTPAQATPTQGMPQNYAPPIGQYGAPRSMSQGTTGPQTSYEPSPLTSMTMSPTSNTTHLHHHYPIPANPYAPPGMPNNGPSSQLSQGSYATYDQRYNTMDVGHDGAQDPRNTRPAPTFLHEDQLRMAREILGPWFDSSVPQSIMHANAAMSFGDLRKSLEGIRRLVDKNPAAAESFDVLQMELAAENGQ